MADGDRILFTFIFVAKQFCQLSHLAELDWLRQRAASTLKPLWHCAVLWIMSITASSSSSEQHDPCLSSSSATKYQQHKPTACVDICYTTTTIWFSSREMWSSSFSAPSPSLWPLPQSTIARWTYKAYVDHLKSPPSTRRRSLFHIIVCRHELWPSITGLIGLTQAILNNLYLRVPSKV